MLRPKSTDVLNLKYRGQDNTAIYQEFYKGNFTRQQIVNQAQSRSNGLKGRGVDGEVLVSLFYGGDIGWRSGYFSKFGDAVRLFHLDDYEDNTNE